MGVQLVERRKLWREQCQVSTMLALTCLLLLQLSGALGLEVFTNLSLRVPFTLGGTVKVAWGGGWLLGEKCG